MIALLSIKQLCIRYANFQIIYQHPFRMMLIVHLTSKSPFADLTFLADVSSKPHLTAQLSFHITEKLLIWSRLYFRHSPHQIILVAEF